jgi:hypothetical protein
MPKKNQVVDELILKYVPLKTVNKWDRNKKKHDIPAIIESLKKYGFKDPVKYEPALNKGAGGIVEGNGRIEALQVMFNQAKANPPRGIVAQDGEWMVPVLFGVDAPSQGAAEAYGFDHNNITMMGGEFGAGDIMQMWSEEAVSMLGDMRDSGDMPVSISADDLDAMLDSERERLNEKEEEIRPKTMLRILVSVPVDLALDVQEHVEALRGIPGVEVDVSGNG